jgi:hypothetical protein
MAALAVILILLGAAGSALIALRSGERHDFVAVSKDLEPGHKLEAKDLSRASLSGDTGALLPWSTADDYIGRYTRTRAFKGQPITKDMLTSGKNAEVPSGGALVGVSLDSSRAPSEKVVAGDMVRVITVPQNNDGTSPQVLVNAAEVTFVPVADDDKGTLGDDTLTATVMVPIDKAATVSAAAANKSLVLVKIAPGTKPDVARAGGGG